MPFKIIIARSSADRLKREHKRAHHDMKVELIGLRLRDKELRLICKRVLRQLTASQLEIWPEDLLKKMKKYK